MNKVAYPYLHKDLDAALSLPCRSCRRGARKERQRMLLRRRDCVMAAERAPLRYSSAHPPCRCRAAVHIHDT